MVQQNQKPLSLVLQLLLLVQSPLLFHDKLSFHYIFQFGDSLNDTGNLEWDNVTSLCRNFPYGISLDAGTPRRCSDGLLMIDYFAEFFNVPVNPYLEKGADLSHGVNFAVAGSTALDVSLLREKDMISSQITNNSLSVQLKWFKSHLNSICSDTFERKQKLQKALIIMGEVGGNDYNYPLSQGRLIEELYEMVPDVIQAIKVAAEDLIKLGAITIIIPGNLPIGCLPLYLAAYETRDPSMYDDLNCLKDLNDFCKFHNDRLQEAIKELNYKYSHATIIYADYFSAFRWVVGNAASLGFNEAEMQKACCGVGNNRYNVNESHMCGSEGVPVCADPSKLISWDGLHSTQHTYLHMTRWLLRHNIVPNILVPRIGRRNLQGFYGFGQQYLSPLSFQ